MKIPWNLFRGRSPSARRRSDRYRPVVEILEERLVLSTTGPIQTDNPANWRDMTFTVDSQVPTNTAVGGTVTAQDAQEAQLIGLNQSFASFPYRGAGETVAIIDTGIDYNNPALGGGWGNRVIAGWNFVNNTADPMDDNGHGTFVASIIGSSNATYSGIAPDVDFVALKVLDASGTGTFGNVDLALQWVAAHQAQYNIVAVNLSLGSGNYTSEPYTFLDNDFQTLVNDGVFVAVAAGNDYYTYNSAPGLAFPAVNPSVVSVGATWDGNYGSVTWVNGAQDYYTAPNLITSFTQRDANLDILAPGAMITGYTLNDQLTSMAGTSMATPVIAGAAALIHQALDSLGEQNLANEQGILNIMQQTGTTINDGSPSHDNVVNTGLNFKSINLYAALNSLSNTTTPTPTPPTNPTPSPTEPPVLGSIGNVTMTAGQSQTISLFATDPNGLPVTFTAQIVAASSLDYQLRQQYGLTYAGNYYYNSWGADEKWLLGTGGQWFLITPDGNLREYTGDITTSLLPSAVIANVGTAVYNDPSLLWNAAAPVVPPVTLTVTGNQLVISAPASYSGTFPITVTASDGLLSTTGTFQVTVSSPPANAPVFKNLSNVTFNSSNSSGTITLSATGPKGDKLTYAAALGAASAQAVTLQNSLGLYYLGSYYQNLEGQNEKWFGGANGTLYFLLPDGELRQYTTDMATALSSPQALMGTLTPAFYANPQLLLSPVQPTFKVSGAKVTVTYPKGYVGSFQIQVSVTAGSVTTTQTITATVASSSTGSSVKTKTTDLDAAPTESTLPMAPSPTLSAGQTTPVIAMDSSPRSNWVAATPALESESDTGVDSTWTAPADDAEEPDGVILWLGENS